MTIWTEFKHVILPWLLAAAAVAFLEWRHSVDADRWAEANLAHAVAIQKYSEALEATTELLKKQGFVPPLQAP